MTEVRGLCLASTATLHTLARLQLWLHRPTHQCVLTRRPSLPSMPAKDRVLIQKHARTGQTMSNGWLIVPSCLCSVVCVAMVIGILSLSFRRQQLEWYQLLSSL